jgi:hypothetical protein
MFDMLHFIYRYLRSCRIEPRVAYRYYEHDNAYSLEKYQQ